MRYRIRSLRALYGLRSIYALQDAVFAGFVCAAVFAVNQFQCKEKCEKAASFSMPRIRRKAHNPSTSHIATSHTRGCPTDPEHDARWGWPHKRYYVPCVPSPPTSPSALFAPAASASAAAPVVVSLTPLIPSCEYLRNPKPTSMETSAMAATLSSAFFNSVVPVRACVGWDTGVA
jgi:hypothetical protein